MKFKVNKIADQNQTSANCGFFAAKFLMDRFNGISFAEASGFNRTAPQGEAAIEAWKRQNNILPFGSLHEAYNDEQQGGMWVPIRPPIQQEGFGRPNAKSLVLRALRENGNYDIVAMKLCRRPRESMIERYQNGEKLTYDQLFDTFMLLVLENEKVMRISKNPTVLITLATWNQPSGTEEIEINRIDDISFGELVGGAEQLVGVNQLWTYVPRTHTNRQFLKALLQTAGAWTRKVEAFLTGDEERSHSRTSRR